MLRLSPLSEAQSVLFEDLLRIESISTLPEHREDVRRAAELLVRVATEIGFQARLAETAGHPIVTGELCVDPKAPWVLFYGHYDVQPADPMGSWESPPFEPEIRDGRIYARGVADDKGEVLMNLFAIERLKRTGRLSVNIRLLIEGEEEVGSPSLEPYVKAHQQELSPDAVVISDTTMLGPDRPSLCIGLRGLAGLEVVVQGPRHDLHSGLFGGSLRNPVEALCALLGGLHDDEGRIAVPGFYDQVRPISPAERAQTNDLAFDEEDFLATTGAPALFGEKGFSTPERLWYRPTIEINGMYGGFTGLGRKTIVPAEAVAKITCRLVPDQDPQRILQLVKDYFAARCPSDVRLKFRDEEGTPAAVVDIDHPYVHKAAQALREGFGIEPVFIRMGGSIPVVTTFQEVFHVPVLMMGFGLQEDRFHAPNESFSLAGLSRGIESLEHLYASLGAP